jgi:hypothetical protein
MLKVSICNLNVRVFLLDNFYLNFFVEICIRRLFKSFEILKINIDMRLTCSN